jgi:hypothetical protein
VAGPKFFLPFNHMRFSPRVATLHRSAAWRRRSASGEAACPCLLTTAPHQPHLPGSPHPALARPARLPPPCPAHPPASTPSPLTSFLSAAQILSPARRGCRPCPARSPTFSTAAQVHKPSSAAPTSLCDDHLFLFRVLQPVFLYRRSGNQLDVLLAITNPVSTWP